MSQYQGVTPDTGQLIHHAGGIHRDDSVRLEDLARIAWAHYGQDRRTYEVSLDRLFLSLAVGDMITTVGAGDNQISANTPVTEVAFEFPASGRQAAPPRTTFRTAHAELDFAGIF